MRPRSAIDASASGDAVLVDPGTYLETIDFEGKDIEVESTSGANVTIIDGHQADSVVRFHSNETRAAVLRGFTLQNGSPTSASFGGGISVEWASPTIEDNVITNNSSCGGHGIAIDTSAALIRHNHIVHNFPAGCDGGDGGGLRVTGRGVAEILDNVIEDNEAADGGGIYIGGIQAIIARNAIRRNTADYWDGGTVEEGATPYMVFADNLVYANSATWGGGLYITVPSGNSGGSYVNNTIADNAASTGGSEA